MDDLIRRQRILNELDRIISIGIKGKDGRTPISAEIFRDFVEAVPIIQPEQKIGRWIDMKDCEDCWLCSNCKDMFMLIEGTPKDNNYNYCPNCGAKMDGEEDDN